MASAFRSFNRICHRFNHEVPAVHNFSPQLGHVGSTNFAFVVVVCQLICIARQLIKWPALWTGTLQDHLDARRARDLVLMSYNRSVLTQVEWRHRAFTCGCLIAATSSCERAWSQWRLKLTNDFFSDLLELSLQQQLPYASKEFTQDKFTCLNKPGDFGSVRCLF